MPRLGSLSSKGLTGIGVSSVLAPSIVSYYGTLGQYNTVYDYDASYVTTAKARSGTRSLLANPLTGGAGTLNSMVVPLSEPISPPFTAEGWIWFGDLTSGAPIIQLNGSPCQLRLIVAGSGFSSNTTWAGTDGITYSNNNQGPPAVPSGQWIHAAIAFHTTTLASTWLNGVRQQRIDMSALSVMGSLSSLRLNSSGVGTTGFYYDDYRISKIDRYGDVANITVPTGNFVSDANTVALIDFEPLAPTISTASVSGITYTSAEVTNIEDIAFNATGTKMYLAHRTTTVLHQYTLSTPWDVSTAIYDSKSFSMSAQLGTGRQIAFIFSTDGTKLYGTDIRGKVIYQYTLSVEWDISTASYASKSFNFSAASSFPCGLAASTDGLSFYTCDPISDKVDRYLLSTAWDISTASLTGRTSFTTTTYQGAPQGVTFFNPYSMYVSDQFGSTYQYKLSTPWDVTTATLVGSKATGLGLDIAISESGTKFWQASASATVTQWNVNATS